MESIQNNCNDKKEKYSSNGDNYKEKQIFNNDNISKQDVIELYNQMNKLRRQNENFIPITHNNKIISTTVENDKTINKIETQPEKIKEKQSINSNMIDSGLYLELVLKDIDVVPKEYMFLAHNLLDYLVKNKIVYLRKPAYIIASENGAEIFLRDFLRGIFVRKAKISHIKNFLKTIITNIENIYIKNEKVMDFKYKLFENNSIISENELTLEGNNDENIEMQGGGLPINYVNWCLF